MNEIDRILEGEDVRDVLEEVKMNSIKFGLQDKNNIKKAIKALDKSLMPYDKDDMSNYKSKGSFSFSFSTRTRLNRGLDIVGRVIDIAKEPEWN